ncbi:hypothetical protein QO009_002317, partial [Brevibacillus aydinogluensis]|nr:hypothetical protein [Brevibacillus aydinogluensis]
RLPLYHLTNKKSPGGSILNRRWWVKIKSALTPEIKIEAVNVTNDQVEHFLFYDKLTFARDLVTTLQNHLQEIAHINPRIKEQKRYHLLEHGVSVLNSILERY